MHVLGISATCICWYNQWSVVCSRWGNPEASWWSTIVFLSMPLMDGQLHHLLKSWDLLTFQTRFSLPWVGSHFHSFGPRPSHTSFIAQSSCPHLHGNSFSLGTNVIIPGQNHKYSSWHHFHYPQVDWWSSFTCMPKELNGLSDRVLSHWFPMRKNSHANEGKKIGKQKRHERPGTT